MLHTGLSTASPMKKMEAFFGVTADIQQRVGAFILMWGMFEVSCEPLIWLLKRENPAQAKASTDGKPISEWLRMLKESSESADERARKIVQAICVVAADLLVYRNAIMHGRLTQSRSGPLLVSNSPWIGELKKKPAHRAGIVVQELETAIAIADTLFMSTYGFMPGGLDMDKYDSQSLEDMIGKLKDAGVHARRLCNAAKLGDPER